MSPRTVERIVKIYSAKVGLPEIAPHDLRWTYAKLAYQYGARLDQIQISGAPVADIAAGLSQAGFGCGG